MLVEAGATVTQVQVDYDQLDRIFSGGERAPELVSEPLPDHVVVADERAPGGFEVKATRFALHRRAEPFPLRGEQGTEFELDKRHLWLRSTELSAVLRVKHRLYKAIRDFYDAEGFVEVDPSVITTNACEGGSTLFTFDYFGQTAYLSQSAQMYLEGCIFGTPKVFSITPSFRAEKSRTTKHLTEFHHLEAEYAWWDAEQSRQHQERMVTYLAHRIAKECAADLKVLGQDPERLLKVQAEDLAGDRGDRDRRAPGDDGRATVETSVADLLGERAPGIYRIVVRWDGAVIGSQDVALGMSQPSGVAVFTEPLSTTVLVSCTVSTLMWLASTVRSAIRADLTSIVSAAPAMALPASRPASFTSRPASRASAAASSAAGRALSWGSYSS